MDVFLSKSYIMVIAGDIIIKIHEMQIPHVTLMLNLKTHSLNLQIKFIVLKKLSRHRT